MATINIVGFETQDTSELGTTFGTFSIQNGVARNGGYALRTNPASTFTGYVSIPGHSATGEMSYASVSNSRIRFYFRIGTLPGTGVTYIFRVCDVDDDIKLTLGINSSGNLLAYDNVDTEFGPSSIALATDTWYRINIQVTTGSPGTISVSVDGSQEIFSSAAEPSTFNAGYVLLGALYNVPIGGVDFYYDDFRWSDSAAPPAGRCVILVPAADGTQMTDGTANGAGSAWQCVDDVPNDGDTTYVNSVAGAGIYTAAVDASAISSVNAGSVVVKGVLISRLDNIVQTDSRPSIYLWSPAAGNSNESGNVAANMSYDFRALVSDSIDGGPWSLADIEDVEVGWRENGTHELRATALYVMVDYEDAPPVATGRRRQHHIAKNVSPPLILW